MKAPARALPKSDVPRPSPYRILFDSVSDMAVLIAREADGGYRCLEANEAVAKMEGIPLAAILGKRLDEIHPPENYAMWREIYERALVLGEPLEVEHSVPAPAGMRLRRTRFRALGPDEEGRELLLGVGQDLTDAAQALSEREDFARYRAAIIRLNAILESDRPEEEILAESAECIREAFDSDRCLIGFAGDAGVERVTIPFLAERPGLDLPPYPRTWTIGTESLRAALVRFLEAQGPLELGPEDWNGSESGARGGRAVLSRLAIPIRPKSGLAWSLVLHQCDRIRVWTPAEKRLFQDLSARVRSSLDALVMTRNLRRNEAFRELLTEMLPQLLWTSDAQGKVDFVNRRLREFTGIADLERLGRGEHLHPDDFAGERESLEGAIRDCALYEGEMRVRRRDGTWVWHLIRSAPLLDAQGKLERRVGTCTDISESKRLLEALAASKEQLEAILSGIADAIIAQKPDGRMVYANDAAARQLGFSSAPELIAAVEHAVAHGIPNTMEFSDGEGHPLPVEKIPSRLARQGVATPPTLLRFRIGSEAKERWVIAQATPLFDPEGKVSLVLAMSQDVTELREKEEAVRRLQKLESLGRLAGGIAHDFNNLLVSINGYSDLGMRLTEGSYPELYGFFAEIHASGERAASLTRQLLAYGRKQMVQPRILDIDAAVAGMRTLLLRLIGEDIRFVLDLAGGLPAIKADQSQLEQIIMNLVLNARDAMPRGGLLALQTSFAKVEAEEAEAIPGARPGAYLVLTVSDSGTGIDPAIRDRIFDPFFTTKEPGKGTGLGLASVYGIVDQWGGHIRLESEVGKGTRFRIFLPALTEAAPAAPPPVGQDRARSAEGIL